MNDRMKKQGRRSTPKSEPESINGDQVAGDKISFGNITNSQGIAAGRGARVEIRSGIGAGELAELFSTIYQQIETRPPDSLVEKDEITDRVKRIETEVATGEKAEPAKVERWLRNLAAMAPDILDVTLAALTNPVAGISTAIRKIAQKVKEEMHPAT